MNTSIHTYISKCLKNLKKSAKLQYFLQSSVSEYSFKKSASNISDFEEQCSYKKKLLE